MEEGGSDRVTRTISRLGPPVAGCGTSEGKKGKAGYWAVKRSVDSEEPCQ
jgi:hypothetical protein